MKFYLSGSSHKKKINLYGFTVGTFTCKSFVPVTNKQIKEFKADVIPKFVPTAFEITCNLSQDSDLL